MHGVSSKYTLNTTPWLAPMTATTIAPQPLTQWINATTKIAGSRPPSAIAAT